jgi:peptide/nickel transport system permease protein
MATSSADDLVSADDVPGSGGPLLGLLSLRGRPWLAFFVGRVTSAVATLIVASFLVFAAVQLLPGNVAQTVLGRDATPARIAAIDANLKLSTPFLQRYVNFVGAFARGHFGDSTVSVAQAGPGQTPASVSSLIGAPLRNSLILASIALVLIIPLAFGLGSLAAVRAGRAADQAISIPSLAFGALPEFVAAILLIAIFYSTFHLVTPVATLRPGEDPFSSPSSLILPVLTLIVVNVGAATRLVRATTIDVLREDFVMMARLNGYRERTVIWRFALRNALAPNVQFIALVLRYLIGGVIIVESVFNYPGIGSLLVQSVDERDVQMVTVIAMLLAAAYVIINIVADFLVMLLVPRLRTQMQ